MAGGESRCPGLSHRSLQRYAPDKLQACARSWRTSSPAALPSLAGVVGSVPPALSPILPWQGEKQLLSPHLVLASRGVMFWLADVQALRGQVAALSGKRLAGKLENCAI